MGPIADPTNLHMNPNIITLREKEKEKKKKTLKTVNALFIEHRLKQREGEEGGGKGRRGKRTKTGKEEEEAPPNCKPLQTPKYYSAQRQVFLSSSSSPSPFLFFSIFSFFTPVSPILERVRHGLISIKLFL